MTRDPPCDAGQGPNGEGTTHVVFCAGRGFFQHAAVAALSLATVARGRVAIHVLTCDADPEVEARLRKTLHPYPRVEVCVWRVDPARLAGLFVDRHLSMETYLRFLAPEVLPRDIARVVYLDCDVIVLDDIARLACTDLGGKAVGAVADCDWPDAGSRDRLTGLGLGPQHVYVNAGVLVMDLARWRRDRLAERLLGYCTEQGSRLLRHDQDALNAVLMDDICLLDRRWNLQVLLLSRWAKRGLAQDHAATAAARSNPAILHFSTGEKPWRFRAWTRRKALYFAYRDQTAWRGERPAGLSAPQRLEHDLSRLLLRAGLDIYAVAGAWRRLSRVTAPQRRALASRARRLVRLTAR